MADKQNKNLPEQPETEASVEKSEKTESPKKTRKPNAAFQKKLKYGGLATAITCVAVAIVVVVNLLVSRLVERYPLKLDLTANGVYEISEDSISFLQGMEKEVNFTVLMSESSFETNGTYMKMVSELLERYAQYSDKIHLTYADPTTNPDVVNRYQTNYAGTLTQGDIVVSDAEDDTKIRVVSVSSLFSYDQQKYNYYAYTGQGSLDDCITGFSGEQNLTSALMYVTDANPVRVAVLASANGEPLYNQNYNGYSLAMFSTLLMRNGYDIQTVDLYTDTLDPTEYDLAVLPAPVNDLTSSAIDSISAFLYNDGEYNRNLIYFADFTQSATPNLDELLSTWGIEVTQNLVMEGNSSAAQQVS
ncbi:MAG: GldG family protein, partial [Oscillospiraceae bacterium]|nr:GldG family protein [Oscillospiraceae bacterium]